MQKLCFIVFLLFILSFYSSCTHKVYVKNNDVWEIGEGNGRDMKAAYLKKASCKNPEQVMLQWTGYCISQKFLDSICSEKILNSKNKESISKTIGGINSGHSFNLLSAYPVNVNNKEIFTYYFLFYPPFKRGEEDRYGTNNELFAIYTKEDGFIYFKKESHAEDLSGITVWNLTNKQVESKRTYYKRLITESLGYFNNR